MMSHVYVNEIFYSLQGEGTRAGLPCVFVRLRGCPLRCHYCDTAYAFHEGSKMSFEEVIAEGERLGGDCTFWQLTGGEPLAQKNAFPLIEQLCDLGKEVVIETSGAVDIAPCDTRSIKVLDLKTPGSGEDARNLWRNLDLLTARDEVKVVLTSREDYDWMKTKLAAHDLVRRVGAVLVSAAAPMAPGKHIQGCTGLAVQDLAAWLLEDRLQGVRLQTQLHKLIWDPQARGV